MADKKFNPIGAFIFGVVLIVISGAASIHLWVSRPFAFRSAAEIQQLTPNTFFYKEVVWYLLCAPAAFFMIMGLLLVVLNIVYGMVVLRSLKP